MQGQRLARVKHVKEADETMDERSGNSRLKHESLRSEEGGLVLGSGTRRLCLADAYR